MYDLSWLNPTPRAIAVYASQPLSPVATQHSLPSGRYSLLGPDFHRLDRTSFVLAHLFDHLVGAGAMARMCGLIIALPQAISKTIANMQRNWSRFLPGFFFACLIGRVNHRRKTPTMVGAR
jgi:hypothetical protein